MAYKKGGLKQGYFIPRHPEKCILTEGSLDNKGNFYRSGWEKKFMQWADGNPNVVSWSSEPFSIKYWSAVKEAQAIENGRIYKGSNYYIDFYIKTINDEEFLVEVKPKKECTPPVMPRKKTEKAMMSYKKALMTYEINQAKWKYARAFAEEKGVKFIIITEDDLGV